MLTHIEDLRCPAAEGAPQTEPTPIGSPCTGVPPLLNAVAENMLAGLAAGAAKAEDGVELTRVSVEPRVFEFRTLRREIS